MTGRLAGKVAVIAGATSGIGRTSAECFVAEGAKVVIAGRSRDAGVALAERLGAAASYVRTDVTVETDIAAMIDHALSHFGRLDCLFNNAGGPAPRGGIAELATDGFDAAMAVLLRGVALGMKHAAPHMVRQGSGSMINTASVAGLRTGYSSHTYSAAKAAVIHLSKCVAIELAPHNVRVNSLSPGGIATPIFGRALGLTGQAAEDSAERVKAVLAHVQPIPRPGLPDDIAAAPVYLASDDSAFVAGHDLVVDGGLVGGRSWAALQDGVARMVEAFDGV